MMSHVVYYYWLNSRTFALFILLPLTEVHLLFKTVIQELHSLHN